MISTPLYSQPFSDSRAICEFNRSFNAELQNTCEPLFQHLGFKHFGYKKYFLEGSLQESQLILETNQEWMDIYAEQRFFNENDFLVSETKTNSTLGFSSIQVIADHIPCSSLKLKALKNANMWNGISFFMHHDTYQEAFHFTSCREDAAPLQNILNNLEKSLNFITFFKSEMNRKLQTLTDVSYFMFPRLIKENDDRNVQHFFLQTPLKKVYIREFQTYFTSRELECLYLACLGQTFKQIGRYLHISPRTVEYIFNSMKNKTNCAYKQDLIRIFESKVDHYCAHLKQKLLH